MKKATQFHFITLFPETIGPWLDASILGRARRAGVFDYSVTDLRGFGMGPHRSVDDAPYGGGGGMVLRPEPLVAAVESITVVTEERPWVIAFTPTGAPLNQALLDAHWGAPHAHYVLVCGHYEGIDQRFLDGWVDQEISLGDFVVTGGELPALAFTDALVRGLDGSLREQSSSRQETFSLRDPTTGSRLLEYPHYTRPAEFRGRAVPEVLVSGDHAKVAQWRLEESISRTQSRRPDLLTSSSRSPNNHHSNRHGDSPTCRSSIHSN